ncbi:ribonuclease HII [Methylotenera mobilis]|uniref:Ribonuclease HII n=1 Tax=Methylotenera mobilis (strain JLW8 / ATCC BAA-1282 / DSM 17540) TaxID=583345 RepID=C6WVW1_METML|nr:ribonuclease HII [Methylotenera mobilis]ACT48060.1 Ribonuclease H [Methylotenera mobilis JLW8]
MQLICGVDEAGRGPLAGAVYAAAVILDPAKPIHGLADSKKLSEKKRDALALEIKTHALAWGVAHSTVEEIDAINILQASLLAMQRAIESIQNSQAVQASLTNMQLLVQVDGNKCPKISLPCEAIVKGDSKVQAISAASILAKTARDAALYELDQQYPMYGFAQHKGYPTAAHMALLRQHGVSPVHRRSYAPVRALIPNY